MKNAINTIINLKKNKTHKQHGVAEINKFYPIESFQYHNIKSIRL